MVSATPLRSLGTREDSGLRVLSAPDLGYADGAEGRLAEIVGGATDLSSASRELADQATDWATSYSLVPGRANLLRSIDLRPDMRVLEIGCGCGPITRYLGERAGLVDSIEPMPARATVARLRTRDLDGVQVYIGTLDDVPAEPTYDLVVVVGVLEYVGNGAKDRQPYLDFLAKCREVLVPGGTLLVAIENALGVKYLAGAGEDHTSRPFDSLEDYALKSPARTFSRAVLEDLVTDAGLTPSTVLGAFPDYKLPRVIVSDALFDGAPQLATRLPKFPSPDWVVPRLQLADEAMLWRTLVEAGVARDFVNSFVVLATKGAAADGAVGAATLWPTDRLAVMFNTERQPCYAVRSEVVRDGDGTVMRRSRLYPEIASCDDFIRHTPPEREPVLVGAELLDVVVAQPERRKELLKKWAALVPDGEWTPVDLVPHNVMVAADGSLVVVDQEWWVQGYRRDCVLVRGLLWAAVRMAAMTRPEVGAPHRTVKQLMAALAGDMGLKLSDDLLKRFVAAESRFQAAVNTTNPTEADRRQRSSDDLKAIMTEDLLQVRGGERFDTQWQRAVEELRHTAEKLDQKQAEVERLEHQLHRTLKRRARRLAGRILRRLHLRR